MIETLGDPTADDIEVHLIDAHGVPVGVLRGETAETLLGWHEGEHKTRDAPPKGAHDGHLTHRHTTRRRARW